MSNIISHKSNDDADWRPTLVIRQEGQHYIVMEECMGQEVNGEYQFNTPGHLPTRVTRRLTPDARNRRVSRQSNGPVPEIGKAPT